MTVKQSKEWPDRAIFVEVVEGRKQVSLMQKAVENAVRNEGGWFRVVGG